MIRINPADRRRMNKAAKEAAEALLADWDTSHLPINPFDLAKHLDLTVHCAPTGHPLVAGFTEYLGNGRFEITVSNTLDNEGLINFTLAHEIAHCAIDGHCEHLFAGSGSKHSSGNGNDANDGIERQADYFAACLLMPQALCKPLVVEQDDRDAGLATIKLLSDSCRTSRNAAAIRYISLTDVPTAIFVSRDNQIEYCFISEELIEQLPKGFQWPRRGTTVPKYMPTYRLGASPNAVAACEEPEGAAINWSDWLDGMDGEAYEQCIGLGRIGKTLTVVTAN